MAGLPKKYAKLGFKEGWKAFKKVGGGAAKRATKQVSTRAKRVSTKTKRVAKVATKRGRAVAKKVYTRAKPVVSAGTGELINGAYIVGGAVASNAIVQKVPMISKMSPWAKIGIQGAAGVAGAMMAKKKVIKKLAVGSLVAAGLNILRQNDMLATMTGPGEPSKLTPSEWRAMLGKPVNAMGVPVRTMGKPVRMNGPSSWNQGWN